MESCPRPGSERELRAEKFLAEKNYKILKAHTKIIGVEVDLLTRNAAGILTMVEVKSERSCHFGIFSKRQKQRLQRVQSYLIEREPTLLLILVEESLGQFLEIALED